VWEVGLVQGPYDDDPWSTEHWTLAPASAVNPNVGVLSLVSPDGPESTVRSGAAVSTENACESLAWFPAASVARTRKVYLPSESGAAGAYGLAHGTYDGAP
jgi:hypothetical protein